MTGRVEVVCGCKELTATVEACARHGVDETAPLFRCTVCGKWSHAKRKPRAHQRLIFDTDGDPESSVREAARLGLPIVQVHSPRWNGDPDTAPPPTGVWVACGPFESWLAVKDA